LDLFLKFQSPENSAFQASRAVQGLGEENIDSPVEWSFITKGTGVLSGEGQEAEFLFPGRSQVSTCSSASLTFFAI
jgi:hypothetical protein